MNKTYILIAILVSAVCTFTLRAFPFLLVGQLKGKSEKLSFLGRILPPAIMAVLLIYCLRDVPSNLISAGIPKMVGVLVTGGSYLLKRNTFLSILLGTVTYMLLITFF